MSRTLDLPRALPETGRGSDAMWRRLGRPIAGALRDGVHAWMVRRAIASLQALDDRMLKDIGSPRGEIEYAVRQRMTRRR